MTDDILDELDDWIELIEKSEGFAKIVLLSANTHKRAAEEIRLLREAGNMLISVMSSGSDSAWDEAIDNWEAISRKWQNSTENGTLLTDTDNTEEGCTDA